MILFNEACHKYFLTKKEFFKPGFLSLVVNLQNNSVITDH